MQRWPAVPTAAKTMRAHGQVEVGARRDDHRVVAAELEHGAAEPRCDHAAPRARPIARASRWPRPAARAGRRPALRRRRRRRPRTSSSPSGDRRHAPRRRLQQRLARRARSAASSPTASRPPCRRRPAPARRSSPDRDREVEGRDDADHAERMPRLHHAVPGRSDGDGQAVELARQADREVADVDHLLHFAQAFLQRSCRPRASPAARGRPCAARSSSPSRRTSSPRRGAGHVAPRLERGAARGRSRRRRRRPRSGRAGDHLAGDRRAHLEVGHRSRSRVEPEPVKIAAVSMGGSCHGRCIPSWTVVWRR